MFKDWCTCLHTSKWLAIHLVGELSRLGGLMDCMLAIYSIVDLQSSGKGFSTLRVANIMMYVCHIYHTYILTYVLHVHVYMFVGICACMFACMYVCMYW